MFVERRRSSGRLRAKEKEEKEERERLELLRKREQQEAEEKENLTAAQFGRSESEPDREDNIEARPHVQEKEAETNVQQGNSKGDEKVSDTDTGCAELSSLSAIEQSTETLHDAALKREIALDDMGNADSPYGTENGEDEGVSESMRTTPVKKIVIYNLRKEDDEKRDGAPNGNQKGSSRQRKLNFAVEGSEGNKKDYKAPSDDRKSTASSDDSSGRRSSRRLKKKDMSREGGMKLTGKGREIFKCIGDEKIESGRENGNSLVEMLRGNKQGGKVSHSDVHVMVVVPAGVEDFARKPTQAPLSSCKDTAAASARQAKPLKGEKGVHAFFRPRTKGSGETFSSHSTGDSLLLPRSEIDCRLLYSSIPFVVITLIFKSSHYLVSLQPIPRRRRSWRKNSPYPTTPLRCISPLLLPAFIA